MSGSADNGSSEDAQPQDEAAHPFAPAEVYALPFRSLPWPQTELRDTPAIRAASVSASFVIHVCLAAAAVFWIGEQSGLIKEMSDAISIEMHQTPMTEQHEIEEMSEVVEVPAPAITAGTPDGLSELEPVEAEAATAESAPLPPVSSQEGIDALKGAETVDEAIGTETRDETKPHEDVREHKPEKTQQQKAAESTDKKDAKSKKGIPAPENSAGAKAKAAPVSASTGSVLNYASRVRAKVSGHVPRSGAGKGTVVISFAVTKSGGLSGARVSRSSGNAAIDRAALAGVRASAPFPPPPAGASPSQLRFSVAFQFR
ncbi:TonB family protein [Hyphomicrobium sp.]|uniref:energy transducer TonB family protein n=1 Tax=Hyphomicrobium sp. TaxID=82 RepID=UPI002E30021C|nr:TonB family protein [Hyphomicrobium sp.]HEX2842286.1 TonB family protein [Hyphomicrobium sp.]